MWNFAIPPFWCEDQIFRGSKRSLCEVWSCVWFNVSLQAFVTNVFSTVSICSKWFLNYSLDLDLLDWRSFFRLPPFLWVLFFVFNSFIVFFLNESFAIHLKKVKIFLWSFVMVVEYWREIKEKFSCSYFLLIGAPYIKRGWDYLFLWCPVYWFCCWNCLRFPWLAWSSLKLGA